MKCPHCQKSISFFVLRSSFACPHCGQQLKGKINRLMLIVFSFGALPWLLAEALFFGFNSMAISFFLVILSHWVVLMFALSGILEEDNSVHHDLAPEKRIPC